MKRKVDFVWLEGYLEENAARRLLNCVGFDTGNAVFAVAGGNGEFWKGMGRRDASAKAGLTVVALGDLEQEACPPALIRRHLPHGPAPGFVLRLAVRMLEGWLMADREQMAAFLKCPLAKVSQCPDLLEHPKKELVNLARRFGTRAIKADIVPEAGHSGLAGKGYRIRMAEFIDRRWRPREAALQSPSLQRALRALDRLSGRL